MRAAVEARHMVNSDGQSVEKCDELAASTPKISINEHPEITIHARKVRLQTQLGRSTQMPRIYPQIRSGTLLFAPPHMFSPLVSSQEAQKKV